MVVFLVVVGGLHWCRQLVASAAQVAASPGLCVSSSAPAWFSTDPPPPTPRPASPAPLPPVSPACLAAVTVVFSKFDALRLERVVGSARSAKMLKERKTGTFLFC